MNENPREYLAILLVSAALLAALWWVRSGESAKQAQDEQSRHVQGRAR